MHPISGNAQTCNTSFNIVPDGPTLFCQSGSVNLNAPGGGHSIYLTGNGFVSTSDNYFNDISGTEITLSAWIKPHDWQSPIWGEI